MYRVSEIFVSPQGEGANAGRVSVFVRFAGCNQRCNGDWSDVAYRPVCDTDFAHGYKITTSDLVSAVASMKVPFAILTGGEPALQVDEPLVSALQAQGIVVAIETNGTKVFPEGIDYVAVSPKTAEHTMVVRHADEVRYVRAYGQAVPKPRIKSTHRFISPAWQPDGSLRREDLQWCVKLCTENPQWRLSVQTHKLLALR